jgi:transposase
LIVPDTQLRRLGLPPPENSQKAARLFFFDEANVSWCPKTGRIYRDKGSEYKVDTPGKNQRKYLIGSLEYPSGAGLRLGSPTPTYSPHLNLIERLWHLM